MGSGSHAQQVHHHQLAVVVPAGVDEAHLGRPAVRQQRGVFGEPGPVDAIEDGMGKVADILVLEILPAGEDSAKQHGGVDR